MKKYLITLIASLLFANSCIAQQILWEKLYGNPGGNEVVAEIHKLTDTTFAVDGVDGRLNGRFFYHKIDQHGNYIWQRIGRTFGAGEHSMSPATDGGYIIAGNKRIFSQPNQFSDLYLQKANSFGDTLWAQVYHTPTERTNYPTKVLELPNRDIAVIGYADLGSQRSYFLLLADSLGNQKWYKHYAKGLNASAAEMLLNHKGNFVLSGITTPNTVTLNFHPYLIEVSQAGDSVLSRSLVVKNLNYSEHIYRIYNNIIQTQDSGYVFSGYYDSLAHTSQGNFYLRGMIVKTDTAFNVRWSYFFKSPDNAAGLIIKKVRELPDGSLLFIANNVSAISNLFYLVHLNSQGQFLSYQTYASAICTSVGPYDFTVLPDSSAIVVGDAYPGGGYLARVKDIYSGSTVLSTPEALPGQKAVLADAYPNPAQTEVTIPYIVPTNTREASLQIHELVTGRVVKEVELRERGQQQARVELEHLKPGIYSYTLIVDGKRIATKKLVVIK